MNRQKHVLPRYALKSMYDSSINSHHQFCITAMEYQFDSYYEPCELFAVPNITHIWGHCYRDVNILKIEDISKSWFN